MNDLTRRVFLALLSCVSLFKVRVGTTPPEQTADKPLPKERKFEISLPDYTQPDNSRPTHTISVHVAHVHDGWTHQRRTATLSYDLRGYTALHEFLWLDARLDLTATERYLWLRWIEFIVCACGTAQYLTRFHPHLFDRYCLLTKELRRLVRERPELAA